MSESGGGDRIVVFKREWLDLILSGEKNMEIRGQRLKAGSYYLGCKGYVYGKAVFGDALLIRSCRQWKDLKQQHRVDKARLPYKRTWGLPILLVHVFGSPFAYQHPRGAIGIVKLRLRT